MRRPDLRRQGTGYASGDRPHSLEPPSRQLRQIRRLYPRADAIVAVSQSVADGLEAAVEGVRGRIETVYNPVWDAQLIKKAAEPLDHPWFAPAAPPVILGVGRLSPQKDFPTLLRAFSHVRTQTMARLMILGGTRKAERHEHRKRPNTSRPRPDPDHR